ncbi:arylsulfatase B-like isoform X2 [Dermacentor variabilis]|uniref:arylsulfatase B-like isoform X2 n=1 Tax=Dermacentor variabilis TaxID=34621 RepID=UPI003F5B6E77
MFLQVPQPYHYAAIRRTFSTVLALALLCVEFLPAVSSPRPHIVFILADDMGWNDVSFHGSNQIGTPNLDVLASEGIILDNYYTMQLCTPSRAALLSGLYPIRTGMQSGIIGNAEPWGLPLNLKLIPAHFKDLGYTVHMIGKWHVGFFKTDYTPLRRGFDSFYGYYTGRGDYYDHTSGLPFFGYLSHMAPHVGPNQDPFQAPEENVRQFSYIGDKDRSRYAGMVQALDESVGAVVDALYRAGMLNDTIIVFSSDNGAALFGEDLNGSSSWPLRGCKSTLWEGGIRAPAFIWSARLKKRRRASRQMMHIVDWLPTLYSAAGGSVSCLGPMDGINMWQALSEATAWPRQEILHNIDPQSAAMALRVGSYKLLVQAPRNDSKNKDNRNPAKGADQPVDDLVRLRASSRHALITFTIRTVMYLTVKQSIQCCT